MRDNDRWMLPSVHEPPRSAGSPPARSRRTEERGVRDLAGMVRSEFTNRGDVISDDQVVDARIRARDGEIVGSRSGETGVRRLFTQRVILKSGSGKGRKRVRHGD